MHYAVKFHLEIKCHLFMMFWQKIRIYVAVCVCWILVLIAGWYTCNACRVIDWHVWQVIDWCEWQVWSTWVTGDSWLTCLTGEWLMCLTGERSTWVTGDWLTCLTGYWLTWLTGDWCWCRTTVKDSLYTAGWWQGWQLVCLYVCHSFMRICF